MLRVGIIRGQSPAVEYYRTVGVFPHLSQLVNQSSGATVDLDIRYYKPEELASDWGEAYSLNLIVCNDLRKDASIYILKQAQSHGVFTWVDIDDDLFAVPVGNNSYDFYQIDKNLERVVEGIKAATVVTVTTEPLKEKVSQINPNTFVVPNAYHDDRYIVHKPNTFDSKPVTIGWRGGNAHQQDLAEVDNTIEYIINNPDEFALKFFGYCPYHLKDRVEREFFKSNIFQYFMQMVQDKMDYIFVPLSYNEFNLAKSNIAWLEATQFGSVTIAPSYIPEFNQPGVLKYKDETELREILERIKTGKIDRLGQLELSQKAMLSNYRLTDINQKRLDIIKKLFSRPEEDKRSGNLKERLRKNKAKKNLLKKHG